MKLEWPIHLCKNIVMCPTVDVVPPDDYYRGNELLHVYSRSTKRFDTQEIVNILLDPDLKEEKICKTQPTDIKHIFVDISRLDGVKDISCDDMGSWRSSSVYGLM